jgi:hypothetical protein
MVGTYMQNLHVRGLAGACTRSHTCKLCIRTQREERSTVAGKLSNTKCEEAKSATQPYWVADQGGLALLVTPGGGKLWRWRYRFEGKMKQMAFGKYPDVSLEKARLLHTEARALLATGVDPMMHRKEQKTIERTSSASVMHILPTCEQERFQTLYINEQKRFQRLYASEKERRDQARASEDERLVRTAFDLLIKYLLALKIEPQIIQNELGRRQII